MKTMLPLSLLAVTLAGCATPPQIASAPAEPAPSFAGSVSAADPRAQAAGEAMLARGGSATDAAIAIMLALTVVEPQSSGIGGGGFMVRGTADGVVSTFDGRETAPAGATPEWFLDASGNLPPRSESVRGGRSASAAGMALRPLIVEANWIGWGASGRNGGVVSPKFRLAIPDMARRHGQDVARRMAGLGHEAVDAVKEAVRRDGIDDADLTMTGNLRCAHTRSAFDALKADQLKLEQMVRVSKNAQQTPGSRMFIEPGKPVTVADLLRGMILQSGNDVIRALCKIYDRDFATQPREATVNFVVSGGFCGRDADFVQRTEAFDALCS